ncbi:glycoside hydrolase, partial [Aureobasidium pullulans]
MTILGDILSCAFDTPSGVLRDWNSIAGASTMILEFARLSDITRNQTYANLAQIAEEYLLKPYLYESYLERWLVAADSTIRLIGSHPCGHPEWTLLPSWDGSDLQNSMESLSWFAGGNFILGGMITDNQTLVGYGLSIADAAGAVYNSTRTCLGGEFVTWTTTCETSENDPCNPDKSIQLINGRFRLRPEVLETWYYAYRATKDPKYQDWSWAAFEAIYRYCRTETGVSSIIGVNAIDGGGKGDVQESFVFAE